LEATREAEWWFEEEHRGGEGAFATGGPCKWYVHRYLGHIQVSRASALPLGSEVYAAPAYPAPSHFTDTPHLPRCITLLAHGIGITP
jgi:hypothetical protein